MKIGFFDSGMGGLSVLDYALRNIENGEYIYYADEKHVPFGEKKIDEIIEYTDSAVNFMIKNGAKAVVLACNTATSAAAAVLREKYSIPIIGMEPAVKKALAINDGKRVLAAATPVTVKGKKMKDLIERVDDHHLIDLIALPGLVTFAEAGTFDGEEVSEYLSGCFAGYELDKYSSIVLGCTHFNYFKKAISKVCKDHDISFVDGIEGTVRWLVHETYGGLILREKPQDVGNDEIFRLTEFVYSGEFVSDIKELARISEFFTQLDSVRNVSTTRAKITT